MWESRMRKASSWLGSALQRGYILSVRSPQQPESKCQDDGLTNADTPTRIIDKSVGKHASEARHRRRGERKHFPKTAILGWRGHRTKGVPRHFKVHVGRRTAFETRGNKNIRQSQHTLLPPEIASTKQISGNSKSISYRRRTWLEQEWWEQRWSVQGWRLGTCAEGFAKCHVVVVSGSRVRGNKLGQDANV